MTQDVTFKVLATPALVVYTHKQIFSQDKNSKKMNQFFQK